MTRVLSIFLDIVALYASARPWQDPPRVGAKRHPRRRGPARLDKFAYHVRKEVGSRSKLGRGPTEARCGAAVGPRPRVTYPLRKEMESKV